MLTCCAATPGAPTLRAASSGACCRRRCLPLCAGSHAASVRLALGNHTTLLLKHLCNSRSFPLLLLSQPRSTRTCCSIATGGTQHGTSLPTTVSSCWYCMGLHGATLSYSHTVHILCSSSCQQPLHATPPILLPCRAVPWTGQGAKPPSDAHPAAGGGAVCAQRLVSYGCACMA